MTSPTPRFSVGAEIARLCSILAAVGHLACAGTGESDLKPTGRRVEGNGGAYALSIPNEEWFHAPIEGELASRPDINLVRKDRSAWISATSRKEQRIEEIVWERRAALLEAGASNYRETRYFLEGSPRITASLSRYVSGSELLLVLVAVDPPFSVELISTASRADGTERELLAILESIRFSEKVPAQ